MTSPPGNAPAQPPRASSRTKTLLWLALGLVPIVGLIALRMTVVTYKIPSGAMTPTILIGDHLFAHRGAPEPLARGQVVVFQYPANRAQELISRAIALPGDTLEVLDGRPILNGWLVPHCKVGPYPINGRTLTLTIEFLGDKSYGVLHEVEPLDTPCNATSDCASQQVCVAGLCGATLQGPFRVPSGQLWAMGDNRDNAFDSRAWAAGIGAGVPFDHLRAHDGWVWMSAPGAGDRIGKRIDGAPTLPATAAGWASTIEKCLRERPPIEETTPPPPR